MDNGTADTRAELRRAAACVDRILLEQGEYSPLELVLSDGLLAYADYEAWRRERIPVLEDALRDGVTRARRLLQSASAYALRLGLVPETVEYRSWTAQGYLRCSREAEDIYRTRYRSPADTHQLDLFHDSAEVVLLNGLREALTAGRESEAQRLLGQCRRTRPQHALLPAIERLVSAQRMRAAPLGDAAQELARLSTEVEPAAARVLGARARDFLVPHWRRLAAALAGYAFDPEQPELHASFAAARAEDWAAVRAAVEAEACWQSRPALVLRHAQAAERLGENETALADWCRLCWRFPIDAAGGLAASRFLSHEWSAFQNLHVVLATEDFPAWLAIRGDLRCAVPDDAGNARLREILAILQRLADRSAPIPDPAVVADREALKALHPALFDLHMAAVRRREAARSRVRGERGQ